MNDGSPGSAGERVLQRQFGTTTRAETFYATQVRDRLNERMLTFLAGREMMFVSTSDGDGHCDCSVRCGPAGFVIALDERTIVYPEYRGNGVMASLGNISENAHVGLLLIDFERDCVGLHLNGRAAIVETDVLLATKGLPQRLIDDCQTRGGRRPERWVRVEIDEAYIHCAKHLPMMAKVPKKIDWGTDDAAKKGGDYFGVAGDRPAK